MGRKPMEEGEKRERVHATIRPGLKGRYERLNVRTGLELSKIVEAAMLRAIEDYEADPTLIVKDLMPKPEGTGG